jgi:hypothetical protein
VRPRHRSTPSSFRPGVPAVPLRPMTCDGPNSARGSRSSSYRFQRAERLKKHSFIHSPEALQSLQVRRSVALIRRRKPPFGTPRCKATELVKGLAIIDATRLFAQIEGTRMSGSRSGSLRGFVAPRGIETRIAFQTASAKVMRFTEGAQQFS